MPVTIYKKQKEILRFLEQYIQKYNSAPTLREIANAIGVRSMATVHEHLSSMEEKGLIQRSHGAARGIELVGASLPGAGQVELPVLGFIAAGKPIEPFTDPNAFFSVSPQMIGGKKKAYVLKVRGESMVDDGILDGDYVVIEEQESADNGDIVVALLENGLATLKRFYRESTRVRLEPANASMQPIFAKSVQIQGRVVGIVRRYS